MALFIFGSKVHLHNSEDRILVPGGADQDVLLPPHTRLDDKSLLVSPLSSPIRPGSRETLGEIIRETGPFQVLSWVLRGEV